MFFIWVLNAGGMVNNNTFAATFVQVLLTFAKIIYHKMKIISRFDLGGDRDKEVKEIIGEMYFYEIDIQ
jgi:hypothetical protein